MKTIEVYFYENYSLSILLDEDDNIIDWDTADDAMWCFANSVEKLCNDEELAMQISEAESEDDILRLFKEKDILCKTYSISEVGLKLLEKSLERK